MLPDAEDPPALFPQGTVDLGVPLMVALDLLPPPLGAILGPCGMKRAAVPETPVHKNGDLHFGENEIRLSENGTVAPPPGNPASPHEGHQSQLRILVPTPANPGHHLGALGFSEYVGHPGTMAQIRANPSRDQSFVTSGATMSAICFARSGGTALPTWWYCSVRGPSKK